MTDKNFVNLHVLISHSPSCLNRDDMNLQKTAVFGGVTRVRISSQSLKRSMRTSDYYKRNFKRSMRTRYLIERLVGEAVQACTDQERAASIEKTGLYLAALVEGKTKPEEIKSYKRANSGKIEHQVMPFHEEEMNVIGTILNSAVSQPESKRIDFLKSELKSQEMQQKGKITLDVALSGRMAASDILYPVEGAMAIAHAITTHSVEPQDLDWFTAVDDLVQDSGDSGAGHLNTQQFSSGVFYRYASLNIRQLQENLGNAPRERALEIAKHLLHMLATIVPSAKQQSFAAHNPADFAIVSLADQPISLANAFEAPVERGCNGGYLPTSIKKLSDYWERMNRAYALDETAAAFDPDEAAVHSGTRMFHTLPDIEAWIARGGKD